VIVAFGAFGGVSRLMEWESCKRPHRSNLRQPDGGSDPIRGSKRFITNCYIPYAFVLVCELRLEFLKFLGNVSSAQCGVGLSVICHVGRAISNSFRIV